MSTEQTPKHKGRPKGYKVSEETKAKFRETMAAKKAEKELVQSRLDAEAAFGNE